MEASEEEFVPDLPDGEAGEDAEGSGPALVRRLREKLKKAVEEKQEYLEGWQRSRADFANYKKEEASVHGDREVRVKAQLVGEIIPVLDSLEMAIKHDVSPELGLVHKQFIEALGRLGVERYGAPGEAFDPTHHEALRQVETEVPEEDHTIASIERSGYKLGDTIIRPAQVTIRNHG